MENSEDSTEMNEISEIVGSLFFNISESAKVLRDGPDDYVSSFDINIVQRSEDDDDILIGKATVDLIRTTSAIDDNESIFYIMDAHSQTLIELYEAIYSKNDKFRKAIEEKDEGIGDIVYMNTLELNPEYRGRGLGKILLLSLIEHFCRYDSLVVMKPAPIKSLDKDASEEDKLKWDNGRKKLYKYWSSIKGFASTYRGSHYLFRCCFSKTITSQEMLEKLQ